jgi:hypothetical protein
MTTTQSIFVVFFAIFWGAVSSVQSRWKMFHWPLIGHRHVVFRIALSMALANVAPIVIFAGVFFALRGTPGEPTNQWTWDQTWRQILGGVLPAFAVFGLYRLWLGIVEATPNLYYQSKDDQKPELEEIEPTIESLNLYPKYSALNILFAVVYLLVAGFGVLLAT